MLRQTARNLYNWKGDSPPQALIDAREDAANEAASNTDDTASNSEWWEQYWNEDENAVTESEVTTDNNNNNNVGEQPTSNDLIMAFTILAIGLTCVVLMAVSIYVCCERRRSRQQFDQQVQQVETELNEAQSLARAKKIAQKLRLVEVSCKDGVTCAKTGKDNPNHHQHDQVTGKDHPEEMTVTSNETVDSASASATCGSQKHNKCKQQQQPGDEIVIAESCASSCSSESSTSATKDDEDMETMSMAADADVEQPLVEAAKTTAAETKPPKDEGTHTTTCGIEIEEGADEDDNCCSICLNPYNAHEWISTSNNIKCKHMYHKECIEEWLMKQDGCPVCRRPYLEEEGAERDFAV